MFLVISKKDITPRDFSLLLVFSLIVTVTRFSNTGDCFQIWLDDDYYLQFHFMLKVTSCRVVNVSISKTSVFDFQVEQSVEEASGTSRIYIL